MFGSCVPKTENIAETEGGFMECQEVSVPGSAVSRLLGAASADAALLYIYLSAGNTPDTAAQNLRLPENRVSGAAALLRQLGLWKEQYISRMPAGESPHYTEQDVHQALDSDSDFRGLYEEVQHILGKNLNTEEIKILLGFVRYLGLPADVIVTMVYYCRDCTRRKGSSRSPSLRSLEQEAYRWAENGIDTLEEASAYIQAQNVRNTRMQELLDLFQIRGRSLTAPERRYADKWLDSGFDKDALCIAYERTCLNTGGMNWAYMDKILQRWSERGMMTGEAVRSGDRPVARGGKEKRQVDSDEQNAINEMMKGKI